MRYILFMGGTDYCGTDFEEIITYPDNISDSMLDSESWDLAMSNAESYEYLAIGWDDDFESEEDHDCYYAGVWCNWKELTKEEYKEYQ